MGHGRFRFAGCRGLFAHATASRRRIAAPPSHRECSENLDDNDRLGFNHGGPNTTRRNHTGVDIQANEGAYVYTWQGGNLSPYPTGKCGPHGVRVTHFDRSKTTYCHFSWVPRTSGLIESGALIGRVGALGSGLDENAFHVHIAHERPDGTLKEYFDFTGTKPTKRKPRSQGGC